MTTFSTISGKPYTQSACQLEYVTTRKPKAAWAILIDTLPKSLTPLRTFACAVSVRLGAGSALEALYSKVLVLQPEASTSHR
jgi:hypothetical protein